MAHLKTVYIIVLTTISLAQAWMIHRPSKEKKDVAETTEYVCFPWIFNPGCPLSRWIDWDVVCRTNTLGWEMCEFKKNSDKRKKEANNPSSTKGEEKNYADNAHLKAEDIIIINNVHVNNHSMVVTSPSSSEGVLHELAQIESGKDEYTIIDHIVGNLAAGHDTLQESLNKQQPQVIQLEDVVLLDPSSSAYNSPTSIVDEISGIVNASIQGFQDKLNQTSEVEFDFPSIFLESGPHSDSSSEANAIEETSTLKTAEELSYPNTDKISEEALDKLVTEVFSDDYEVEEELVNQSSDKSPFVKESIGPEVFVIENLKPFHYKVNQQPTELPALNLINKATGNEIPEIISLKPFRFVPIVKVIKHKDGGADSLLNTVEENLNAEIQEFNIIKPRVYPIIS